MEGLEVADTRTRQEKSTWTASEDRDCGECGTVIPAGSKITWGVTGTFAHPACANKAAKAVTISPKAFDDALANAACYRAKVDALIERKAQQCIEQQCARPRRRRKAAS